MSLIFTDYPEELSFDFKGDTEKAKINPDGKAFQSSEKFFSDKDRHLSGNESFLGGVKRFLKNAIEKAFSVAFPKIIYYAARKVIDIAADYFRQGLYRKQVA